MKTSLEVTKAGRHDEKVESYVLRARNGYMGGRVVVARRTSDAM